jgi:hypothetical protein
MGGRTVFALLSTISSDAARRIRHEVGTRLANILQPFLSINQGGEVFNEWGFNLLNRIVYLFTRQLLRQWRPL